MGFLMPGSDVHGLCAVAQNMFGNSTVEYFEQLLDSVKNPKKKEDDGDDDK
jgi:hypothetical protein